MGCSCQRADKCGLAVSAVLTTLQYFTEEQTQQQEHNLMGPAAQQQLLRILTYWTKNTVPVLITAIGRLLRRARKAAPRGAAGAAAAAAARAPSSRSSTAGSSAGVRLESLLSTLDKCVQLLCLMSGGTTAQGSAAEKVGGYRFPTVFSEHAQELVALLEGCCLL